MLNTLQRHSHFSPQRLLLGLLFSTIISTLAYRRRSLSRSGIAGSIITGTITFGLGGWEWGLSLIFFFISSSLLSHFRAPVKAQTATDKFSKGNQRDIGQVAANGGIATLLALGYGLASSRPLQDLFQAGYTGALATATADTWATEIGTLSPQAPRLITSGQPVASGTSGGITPLGTSAATLGALALGLVFWLLQEGRKVTKETSRIAPRYLPLLGLISGLTGSFTDSLLGATFQVMYYCPTCQKETERAIHNCGTRTQPLRGLPWLNNDAVNFIATLCGALTAMGLHLLEKSLTVTQIKDKGIKICILCNGLPLVTGILARLLWLACLLPRSIASRWKEISSC